VDTFRHALVLGCGVALIVLGFVGFHVEVVSIVVGLVLIGAISPCLLVKFAAARARPAEPEGDMAPSAGSVRGDADGPA